MNCAVQRSLLHLIMAVQAVLLAWLCVTRAPVNDEPAHLASGVMGWRAGGFNYYIVNPPLARALAALPSALLLPEQDWLGGLAGHERRLEWKLGREFARQNPENWAAHIMLSRLVCLPLALLGTLVCYRWALALWGSPAGALLSAALFAFSPTVLTWGAIITADCASAALGALAGYCFWRWLRQPNWPRMVEAGAALGLALLSKFTWLILLGLWPMLWGFWVLSRRAPARKGHVLQLAAILAGAIYVINVGYGFDRSFERLGDYTFFSQALAGKGGASLPRWGNRFRCTWLGAVRIPLPRQYLAGIDLQKVDFDSRWPQYLNGTWRMGGWWYFYLEALALKEPLGTWLLGLLAIYLSARAGLAQLSRARRSARNEQPPAGASCPLRAQPGADSAGCAGHVAARRDAPDTSWRDQIVVLAPPAAVLLLLSVMHEVAYLRYALPCYPFAFVWMGKLWRASRACAVRAAVVACLIWAVASCLCLFPHTLSYFNELAGGPAGGHRYMINAQIDWGQDLYQLRDWQLAHPEAAPFHATLQSAMNPEMLGIVSDGTVPRLPAFNSPNRETGPDRAALDRAIDQNAGVGRLVPGWYALSVHQLHDVEGGYGYLVEEMPPAARIGYSILLFRLSLEDVNRLRRSRGLPELHSNR